MREIPSQCLLCPFVNSASGCSLRLLVNPSIDNLGPVVDPFRKPHAELVGGSFGRITAVADIATQINREITTNASRLGSQRLGLSQHLTSLLDDILSFPAHAHYRARAEELNETRKEFLGAETVDGRMCESNG